MQVTMPLPQRVWRVLQFRQALMSDDKMLLSGCEDAGRGDAAPRWEKTFPSGCLLSAKTLSLASIKCEYQEEVGLGNSEAEHLARKGKILFVDVQLQ